MIKKLFLFFVVVLLGLFTNAQIDIRVKHFNADKFKVAVSGYDVVSYFTEGKAVKGNKSYAVVAEGIYYYFSSAANKATFLKNWRAYEPQYGGWCAYAMGNSNEKVEVDPKTFKIVNGKLYLFYHSWYNNTLTSWNKKEATLKASADKNWSALFK